MTKRHCAIYTRKSTEEGLDQAFNSLDAQREACTAYIMSQTHEGWELVNEPYEDGGWSGGTMARPALQQLLADVAAGKIDVLVVYKVDRLTRSLADFARIVDVLDKAGASFVSVTQAFNTTTSMGRLTLNVLLSFAQFEREVTSERIRDKFAASKRKGMWMGGPSPMGYRVADRKLVIDVSEAATVRLIFERYLAVGSLGALADDLAERGIGSKVRAYSTGRTVGGMPFTRGSLSQLLKNPLFIGKVAHGGSLYEGEHDPIVSDELWQLVQNTLAANTYERRLGSRVRYPSLLTGLLTDADGRPMTPVFSSRGAVRHHYYVTRLNPGEDRNNAWRVPAGEIDRAVLGCVARWFRDSRSRLLGTEEASSVRDETATAAELADALPDMNVPEQRKVVLEQQVRVQLGHDCLRVVFGPGEESHDVRLPARFGRKGVELKLVLTDDGTDATRRSDPVLLKLVALSALAQRTQLNGGSDPLVSGYSKRHLWQLLRISWLAPDIIAAIVEGRQPPTLSGRRLLRATDIPLDWAAQRALFGFA